MSRKIQLFTVLVFAILLGWLFMAGMPKPSHPQVQTAPEPADAPPQRPSPGSVAIQPPDPRTLAQVSPHPLAVSFGQNPRDDTSEPAVLLEILRFYRMEFGTFPAGQENREIMNALTGNNPGRLPVFPRNHLRIDSAGNLLDAWGNPFIFHPVSSQHLEVRSSGPDGEIFTPDDITAPPPHPANP